jgi:O-antigen/teichoic acid export membrane protein
MRVADVQRIACQVPGFPALQTACSHVRQGLLRRAKLRAVADVMLIRVIALAGNVFSGLLTAALLGPAGRGDLAAMIVAPTVLAAVSTFGLHASLIYNLRSDPDRASAYFGSAVILMCLSGVMAAVLGFWLLPIWLGHYDAATVAFARLLLITVPLGAVTPLMSGVLEAGGKFGLANRGLYVQSLGALAMLAMLAVFGALTPETAAVAYIFPSIPCFFYLFWKARVVLRPHFTLATLYPRRLLHYGLQYYGVDIIAVLSGYLDQVVVVFVLDPAAVGAYAVALSLSRMLSVAQGAVSTVLFPSIAARESESVVAMVARATRVTAIVNAVCAAGFGLVGPSLLLLLYGTRFAAAVMPFLVLLAEAVVTSAARTLAQAFSGTGRPSVVTAIEFAGVVTSLTAMLVLVPTHGIVGAACSTLLGGGVRLACVVVSFQKVLGVKLPRMLISRADIAWMTGR